MQNNQAGRCTILNAGCTSLPLLTMLQNIPRFVTASLKYLFEKELSKITQACLGMVYPDKFLYFSLISPQTIFIVAPCIL